jgi:lipopolysaccharide export system permease protein
VRFGILQRSVMGEVLRSFVLALLTITIVFVLFIVMTEATRNGLSPRDILALIPFVIPGSLPYTVPVSLLFSVTVVYGRLAGDNEVIAVKTAGLSVWTVLWPSMSLGLAVSLALMVSSRTAIPIANTMAFRVMIKNYEDGFYKYLKKEREFNNPSWPFLIQVKDLVDHEMIGATFKHRAPKPDPNKPRAPGDPIDPIFDMVIQAKRATISFDIPNDCAHIYLDGSDIQQVSKLKKKLKSDALDGPVSPDGRDDVEAAPGSVFVVNDSQFDIPLPPDFKKPLEKRIQQMTDSEIEAKLVENRLKLKFERRRQAYSAALWIGSGLPSRVDWPGFQTAFIDYRFWEQKSHEYETERHMRTAMACGSFFFVFLGSPVGIRFARRDFLSAFITCFVPIILIYYPLMLGGVNLGKDGLINPILALWLGNGVLFLLALLTLRPVFKH